MIFSDVNYQYIWLGGWVLLEWERGTEDPQAELGGMEVEPDCVPTHRSGEVLLIYDHPYAAWGNGKWCRDEEDWNDREHFIK